VYTFLGEIEKQLGGVRTKEGRELKADKTIQNERYGDQERITHKKMLMEKRK